ncbi:DUF1302 family protein [Solimonas sp. K1W22B-7]|uniref:DUF1302 domain-containing protein n=1 Tax=Solimonas sp. K1W22B-7 TaxID=2303331 RepID=UPI000E334809|nr:DUF1302 family protein [Solimonas sp. K1W22B-7]AXQ30137.1 DUF1302 family protein [Solimonas sp. K1W22B-7]
MKKLPWAALLALISLPASALEGEFYGFDMQWKTLLSAGTQVRMQHQAEELIGKTNIPGQQNLCASDDCLSLTGDTAPNQRLVDARGAYFGANGDDGNMAYDKGDVVSALFKINTDLTLRKGDWLGRVHALGFYDPVNADFDQTHSNTLYQPHKTPRPGDAIDRYALGTELYEAFVQYNFSWGESREGAITVGSQIVRWGESTLLALNSISEINPPSYRSLHAPGSEINEVFKPVPAVTIATSLTEDISLELFYQLQWKPAEVDPAGSFFSFTDFIGGKGLTANVSLGQFPEDPNNEFEFSNADLRQLSRTTLTVPVREIDARDDGQYGAKISHFASWLNEGTDLSFYFLNYHSRLPYASMFAADDSCARDSTSIVGAYLDCRGFNGDLPNPIYGEGLEPLPADTVKVVVEYPEDIQMYGFSFNTNVGSWSIAGEYAYRPNLPVLISVQDLFFAAAQPALPANQISFAQLVDLQSLNLADLAGALGAGIGNLPDILANPGQVLGLLGQLVALSDVTFPAATDAFPAYVTRYRGIDRVEAGQYLRGWERFGAGQFGLTAIRAVSDILGADQIIFINEVGFTHIVDMPKRNQLQFETFYLNSTHASGGADGTGQPGGVPPATLRFNPTQQTKGFADDFAWGWRSLIRGEYNDVIFGLSFRPTLIIAWDIKGTAPQPLQNFVEDRKEFALVNDIQVSEDFGVRMGYTWYTGAGDRNNYRDRDNASLSFSYAF